MKTYIQDGDVITVTAPAALTSGDGVVIGGLFGVATTTVGSGDPVAIQTCGVISLAKVSAQAWDVGDVIYWDATNEQATTVAAPGALEIGIATAAAANPSASGYVRLSEGQPRPGVVSNFSMVAAAGGANVCEVTITALDAAGNTVAQPILFDVWLSDAATGAGLTATSASGTVTAKAASGAVFDTLSAKKALKVQSLATGVFILEITDTAKTAFKVCAQAPGTGQTIVGETLVTADYG